MHKLYHIDIFQSEIPTALHGKLDVCLHSKSTFTKLGTIGALKTIICTFFSYLSDYLQIKHKRTHFKSVFLFFTHKRSICVLTRSVCVLTRSVCALQRSVCALKRSVCVLKRSVCAFTCYTCVLARYTCVLARYTCVLARYTCVLARYTCAFIRNACVRMRYTCVVMYNTCERVLNSCAFARCCEKLSLNIDTFNSAYYDWRLKKMVLVYNSNKSGKPLFFSGFS